MADKKKAGGKPASGRARKPGLATRASSRRKTGTRPSARPRKKSSGAKPAKAAKRAKPARKAVPPKRRRRAPAARATSPEALVPGPPGLSEEDAIRSAKYLPRNLPPRLFEEERFLFPESYGIDRVRLLVRDPEWLFAYWDVSARSLEGLRRQVGERAAAVARLTLRISDPVSGGTSDVLLPPGARWWYVRSDSARRSYRAELGFTLASGEFRSLAKSNTVTTPRVGPSVEKASRRLSYRQAGEIPPEAGVAVSLDEMRSASPNPPWSAPNVDAADEEPLAPRPGAPGKQGGASDAFRPGGASDVHRR
jgi:hypothetical protein